MNKLLKNAIKKINYIKNEGNVVIKVNNLQDLNAITYYLEYKLVYKYGTCEICKKRFKLKSNNSNQKYCNKCAKQIKNEQNKKYYNEK